MEPFDILERKGKPTIFHIAKWSASAPGLSAGISSRWGGVGEGDFADLNVALHVDDDPAKVIANRRLLTSSLGFPMESWTCAEQCHTRIVQTVRREQRGAGAFHRNNAIPNTDGLVTNERGVMLVAFGADCVPLFFYDPVRHVVAVVHAGWKGTANDIAGETMKQMTNDFGCRPEQILAAIGPAIGKCCYEVEEELVSQFPAEVYEPKANGRFMLDLKEANRQFMIRAGISLTNIEVSGWCTSCRTDLFFSHRAEHGHTGRMAAWIGWTEEVNM